MDTKVDLYIRLFVIFMVVYSRLPVNSFRMNTARTSRPHLSIAIPRMSSTVEDTNIYDSSSNLDIDGNPVKARMPLKIAVAGAGVGGMFLGYTLQSKGFDVTVFEKSSAFSRFGGPIQLASNALSCVKSIDSELFNQIMGKFTFTGTRKCGIKDGIRNEWYNVFDAITNLAKWNNLPYTGVIDRPDLQEILLDNMKEGRVKNSKPIVQYIENADGTVDVMTGEKDGIAGKTYKGFDVLIGADGIWSNIRAQMWGEKDSRPGSATYSGYTLFAAENVMPPDSIFFKDEGYFDAGYKVYIGQGKYFVTSDVGCGRIQWYAFLSLPPGSKARASNREYVKELFEGWSPEIHACLDNTPDEIIEQRDMYDRRPAVLKSWSKGRVTMLGDAVHPMMPNLGQGGCQALEDAFVLSNLLCDVTDKKQIPDVLQEYYRKRIVRSAIVQGFSRFSSDIIISAFSTPWRPKKMDQEGNEYVNFKSIGTWLLQPFLPIIFYIQFGFLYSFAPTVFKKEEIEKLVQDSLLRNQAEASEVYSYLKEGYNTFFSAKTMSFSQYDNNKKVISPLIDADSLRKEAARSMQVKVPT